MNAGNIDFETYSEAGYNFNGVEWRSVTKSPPHGLGAVGVAVYAEHPSTEVLSLAYELDDGLGPRLWIPGMPGPGDLFAHIANGGILQAFNSMFEFYIWEKVCNLRMGWPALPYDQLRCTMGKCHAFGLAGGLEKVAGILGVSQKIADGKRLIRKFCIPRNPTKSDPRTRITPREEGGDDECGLLEYNLGDIKSEGEVAARVPELPPGELDLWLLDQKINIRGAYIDRDALRNCEAVVEQVSITLTSELQSLTKGEVQSAAELEKMKSWLASIGTRMDSMDAAHVERALSGHVSGAARRVLEIRSLLSAASVKKLAAIKNRLSGDSRLHGLFAFCGASRTGRFAGRGPQPQNLPKTGPLVRRCDCGRHYFRGLDMCPWCGLPGTGANNVEWSVNATKDALDVISYKKAEYVERVFDDVFAAVSGCLRGLFSAAPGKELICSDYSAIEAVVLAMVAGEQWRIDVFRGHGKIYEMSAAKITGVPFEEFVRYKTETGEHHPLRAKIGKVAELASGYQGWVGAWIQFGALKHLSEREIEEAVRAWREASPNIVALWRGLESAVIAAIKTPGTCFQYRGISYGVKDDILQCLLPSGRKLYYHTPRLHPDVTPWGKETLKITYMGHNSDYRKGPIGWFRLDTYGGKLTENVVQAIARDILAHAMLNLERAGYPIVLHVHDEIVAEVPSGFGSIQEFERIMGELPLWCHDWPVRASGGWRGQRYRKE